MSDIVLIHGYGAGLDVGRFKKPREDYEFIAFNDLLANQQAVIFQWEINRKLIQHQIANPFEYHKLYKEEQSKAQNPITHQILKSFPDSRKPSKIIAHSMGCFLLLEYLKSNDLPDSVQTGLSLTSSNDGLE